MRVQISRTTSGYWYKEGGATSWGFGFEVEHFADLYDNGEDYETRPAGFIVSLTLGPWLVGFYSEAGFRQVVGADIEYYGWLTVEP